MTINIYIEEFIMKTKNVNHSKPHPDQLRTPQTNIPSTNE